MNRDWGPTPAPEGCPSKCSDRKRHLCTCPRGRGGAPRGGSEGLRQGGGGQSPCELGTQGGAQKGPRMPWGREGHAPEGGQVLGVSHGGVQAAGEGHVDVEAHARSRAHLCEAETHTSQTLGRRAQRLTPVSLAVAGPHSLAHGQRQVPQSSGVPRPVLLTCGSRGAAPSAGRDGTHSPVLSDRHRPLSQLPSREGDLGGPLVHWVAAPSRGLCSECHKGPELLSLGLRGSGAQE